MHTPFFHRCAPRTFAALLFALALSSLWIGCNHSEIAGFGEPGGLPDLAESDGGAGTPDAFVLPCGLRTCDSLSATCGPIGDGCGGTLDCGTCAAPTTCGGGGKPSTCGGMAGCVARTCALIGATCGPVSDGCGKLLDCGTCPAGQACGSGGKPNVCAQSGQAACVPKTCAQQGFSCGPAGDGCGGTLNCGACAAGQSCGAGGTPGVCGPQSGCTPRTCAQQGFNCGQAGDGCGGTISCGSCPAGQGCGIAGQANVCASPPACVPRTCAQLGYSCGPAGDGCGGTIQCGTCTAPDTCGGGGKPGVCGRTAGGNGNNTCMVGTTTITGTVYAPTNAALGFGNPDPIYNATVYVPTGTPAAFPAGVSCDRCTALGTDVAAAVATSGADGKFVLQNAPCGTNIPLVVQTGHWRRRVTIPAVTCCQANDLPADLTRLPRNKTEGDIPLIAVVTGSADPIECVLPKIGIDASEFTLPSGTGRVRFYTANGANLGRNTPDASVLWGDANELAKYDVIIADCEGSQVTKSATWQKNVIDWTNKGGRLFASHYSYTWLYNVTPFSTTAAWSVNQPQLPDLNALIDQSFPKGLAFATWLKNVGASQTLGRIPVQQVRNDATAVNNPPSQRWMYADPTVKANAPLEFTFNTPVGAAAAQQCGRVLFSDFHVNTGGSGGGRFPASCNGAAPMTPQEKALEFLLFDLSSCVQPDSMPPSTCVPLTCAGLKYNCGPAGDGCGGLLQCGTCPAGQTCGASSPNVCGSTTCVPKTCAQLGATCGAVGDGCGNIIQCGSCPAGQSCGAAGPNQCGPVCVPRTCAQQGFSCGPAGDGCGGALQCGMCPAGQTCGGGLPGICGSGVCVPRTCAQQSLSCGPAGDGCGGTLDCGSCPAGQTCGGGGTPGVCGMPNCTPQTCAALGARCGLIGDGCGGTVDCGSCPAGQTCGGGGQANICGALG